MTYLLRRSLLALAALAFAGAAAAQSWPQRPIRVIVPYPPGGTSDILARALGPGMQAALGQPWVVENKPGATGNVGADLVAKSPADGYTLLLADIGSLAIAPSVVTALAYDPVRDLVPVVMVAYSPHLLVVHPSVAAKDPKELIAIAKAKPDSLNFAVSGMGGANHLAGIDFAQRAGIKWTYIPYKGGSQAVADVVGGQANVLFNGMLATWPSVTGGRLKALAISSSKRVASAAGTPTVAETLPGFETGSVQGVVAAAGTPREIVAKLNAEFKRVLGNPEIKDKLAAQGTEVRADTPDSFGAFIRNETARWAKVVKESGAKFE